MPSRAMWVATDRRTSWTVQSARGASPCFLPRSAILSSSDCFAFEKPLTGRAPLVVEMRQSPSFQRSEEHTSELQSLMRISYAVFCLNKKTHSTPLYTHILSFNILTTHQSYLYRQTPTSY